MIFDELITRAWETNSSKKNPIWFCANVFEVPNWIDIVDRVCQTVPTIYIFIHEGIELRIIIDTLLASMLITTSPTSF